MWQEFADLFEGYPSAYGTYKDERPNEDTGKHEIKHAAETIRKKITAAHWQRHLEGIQSLGLMPIREDNTCSWGAIDVDDYTIDHDKLVQTIHELKLPLIVCETKSGGAHVYMFLKEPTDAEVVIAKLTDIAAGLGFGRSEIFPKQKRVLWERGDLASWINLPYFGDSRKCVMPDGNYATLSQFISAAQGIQIDPKDLHKLVVKNNDELLKDGPPCLQYLTKMGFPEGTRNNGLFALAVFARKKWPDRWEEMLDEFNQKFLDPPLPSAEVAIVVKSAQKKTYQYTCNDMPLNAHCNSALCRTRAFGIDNKGVLPTFSQLSKLDTDEPLWFLVVDGVTLELTTEELTNQGRFQRKCLEKLNIFPGRVKENTWNNLINGLLEDVEVIPAPDDVGFNAQFVELLETFCTQRSSAENRDQIILKRPWLDEDTGRIYFRLMDLCGFLAREKFTGYTRTQVAARLRELGGDRHQITVKGINTKVFWVPATTFSVYLEGPDLPPDKENVL